MRIPVPYEILVPLLIGVGVLVVVVLVISRLQAKNWDEWWNGPKWYQDRYGTRGAGGVDRQRDDTDSDQPKLMAFSIHQLCHVVRHANATFGGGVRIFQQEPYLVSETKPTNPANPEDPYIFLMGGPYEGFRFLFFHEADSIHLIAGGDYTGFGLTTGKANGRYRVYTKQPSGVPMGRYAKPLLKVFISEYGARDTSDLMA